MFSQEASDEKDIAQKKIITQLLRQLEDTLRPMTIGSEHFTLQLSLPPPGSKETRDFNTHEYENTGSGRALTRCECITPPNACYSVPGQEDMWSGLATRCRNKVGSNPTLRTDFYNSTSEALRHLQTQMIPFKTVNMNQEHQRRIKLEGITCDEHARGARTQGVHFQW